MSSDKTKALLEAQKGAEAAAVQDAVSWADVIVLATPGSNNAEGIIAGGAALGPGVASKVIIDATNPLTSYPGLEVRWGGDGTSGGEVLSNSLPNSKVYKAFNTIGAENMDKVSSPRIAYRVAESKLRRLTICHLMT